MWQVHSAECSRFFTLDFRDFIERTRDKFLACDELSRGVYIPVRAASRIGAEATWENRVRERIDERL